MGQGRDAAQPLQKVERDAFGGEDRARAAADFEDGHSRGHDRAIDLHDLDAEGGIDPPEDFRRHLCPGHDGPFLGNGAGRGLLVFTDKVMAGDVPGADVLAQGEIDELIVFVGKIHGIVKLEEPTPLGHLPTAQ